MEEINYDELLNHKVIKKFFTSISVFRVICFCYVVFDLTRGDIDDQIILVIIVGVFIISSIAQYKEKFDIKELVTFYNNSIKKNKFIEASDDLKNNFIAISEYTILDKLEIICVPNFIYNDEITVYTTENTHIVIVDGHFQDVSYNRDIKRKYTMVFVDGEYYMCCIDNLICWEKGTYKGKGYNEYNLKRNKVDYMKW